MDRFAELKESNRYLNDASRLREIFAENGYLFFRRLIDKSIIEGIKEDAIRICKRHGLVDARAILEPLWSRRAISGNELALDQPMARSFARLASMRRLTEARRVRSVLRRLFGREIFSWVPNRDQFKLVPPGAFTISLGHVKVATATPPHQDFYSFRSVDFCTVWQPLMGIPQDVGGLAIMAGSHKAGLFEHWWRGAEQLGVATGTQQAAAWRSNGAVVLGGTVKPSEAAKTWLRTDYEIGDALIFHPLMLHRGLVNSSDRLRFSADFRFQPRGSQIPWEARYRIGYRVQFLKRAQDRIAQMGFIADLGSKIWQEIREEGPRPGRLEDRIARTAGRFRPS